MLMRHGLDIGNLSMDLLRGGIGDIYFAIFYFWFVIIITFICRTLLEGSSY